MTFKKQLELLQKNMLKPADIKCVVNSLHEALVQIITIKKPQWCEKVTGLSKNTFNDLKTGCKNWSIKKKIKVYEIFYKELIDK